MAQNSQSFHLTQITDLCRTILEKDSLKIDPGMSLTRDLGFDSMQLMEFFAGIETYYPEVALEEWFLDHSTGGRDTVGSVADYLSQTPMQIAAE
ncbi:acyl carrier protein [Microvirga sp. 2TAF3]|uniref:acyl carrier protein n=1 Tax=Microvirga sp. 2TAF3 TaxID=3233014 RepID=UPI003F96A85B